MIGVSVKQGNGKKVRVLVVEDEEALQEVYSIALERAGFEVASTAVTGEEAVRAYDEASPEPDVVLMDHRLPVKTGLEAAEDIMERHPGAKIIFVTADGTIREKAQRAGAAGFLVKPFSIDFMIDTIKQVVKK